jgi:RNA 2',3'-cyclic 3'-phosphodiesterase
MSAIRAFIAIELPPELQNKLGEVIDLLEKNTSRVVRWVTVRNIHLTLKFLGNVSPANLDTLIQVIQSETLRHKSMEICVGGVGAFPNKLRPRVVWAGVRAPTALLDLQHSIDHETERLGYISEEREFSPHLTLGRVSQHAGPQEVKLVTEVLNSVTVGELGSLVVKDIRLFRSDLQPGGAIYTPLFSAPFGK